MALCSYEIHVLRLHVMDVSHESVIFNFLNIFRRESSFSITISMSFNVCVSDKNVYYVPLGVRLSASNKAHLFIYICTFVN